METKSSKVIFVVAVVALVIALGAELAPEVPAWRLGLAAAARRLAPAND